GGTEHFGEGSKGSSRMKVEWLAPTRSNLVQRNACDSTARTASGNAAAALLRSVTNARRSLDHLVGERDVGRRRRQSARARSVATPIANREPQKSTGGGRKWSQLFSGELAGGTKIRLRLWASG